HPVGGGAWRLARRDDAHLVAVLVGLAGEAFGALPVGSAGLRAVLYVGAVATGQRGRGDQREQRGGEGAGGAGSLEATGEIHPSTIPANAGTVNAWREPPSS